MPVIEAIWMVARIVAGAIGMLAMLACEGIAFLWGAWRCKSAMKSAMVARGVPERYAEEFTQEITLSIRAMTSKTAASGRRMSGS